MNNLSTFGVKNKKFYQGLVKLGVGIGKIIITFPHASYSLSPGSSLLFLSLYCRVCEQRKIQKKAGRFGVKSQVNPKERR